MNKKKKLRGRYNIEQYSKMAPVTELARLKAVVKKQIIDDTKYTYEDIDSFIFKPKGWTRNVMSKGNFNQVWTLVELVNHNLGISDVRNMFRGYLGLLNITMASASNLLFPDKSQTFLSTVLNEDNKKTYSDEFINQKLKIFRELVENGSIKIGNDSEYNAIKKRLENKIVNNEGNMDNKVSEKLNNTGGYKNMNLLIITNYNKKIQEVLEIKDNNYKMYDDFLKVLKNVGAISNDIEIKPFSIKNEKSPHGNAD